MADTDTLSEPDKADPESVELPDHAAPRIEGDMARQDDIFVDAEGAEQRAESRRGEGESADKDLERRRPKDAQELKGFENAMREGMRIRLEKFEEMVAGVVKQGAERYRTKRDGENEGRGGREGLIDKVRRENEKFRILNAPHTDATSGVDQGSQDSNMTAGLSLGLFTDNCNVVPPIITEIVMGAGEAPWLIEGKGKRDENKLKVELINAMLTEQTRVAGWRAEMVSAIRDLPRHGTCVLRQSFTERTGLRREKEPKGDVWREVPTYRGMAIKHWNLLDVLVSNPERQFAHEQDSIVWYSRKTPGELYPEERVLSQNRDIIIDPATNRAVPAPLIAERGRYLGLERVREASDIINRQGVELNTTTASGSASVSTSDDLDRNEKATLEPLLDVHEWQGDFPLGSMIRNGDITPSELFYYGLEFTLGVDDDGNPERVTDIESVARMADAMTWYVTIVNSSGFERAIVIQLEPCPYDEPRNEMLAAQFIPDGQWFYGMSSNDIGTDVEDAATGLMNALAVLADANGEPTLAAMEAAFEDESDIEELKRPGGVLKIIGDHTVQEAVQWLHRPISAELVPTMLQFIQIYETRTMANAVQKGGAAVTGTDTFAEVQQQLEQGTQRLVALTRRLANDQLILPSVEAMIRDLDTFYTDKELEEIAIRVGGERGIDSETLWPVGPDREANRMRGSLFDEIELSHFGTANVQKEVAFQALMAMAEKFGPIVPQLDMNQMLKDAIAQIGFNPDRYFNEIQLPGDPDDELTMIMMGDAVQPDPREDTVFHLETHEGQKVALQAFMETDEAVQEESPEYWLGVIKVLDRHIMDTRRLQQAQQVQAAAAASAAEGEGAVGPSPGGGGQPGGDEGGAGPIPGSQSAAETTGRQTAANAAGGGGVT